MTTRDNLLRFHAGRRRTESLIVVGLVLAGLVLVFGVSRFISTSGCWIG